MQKKAIEATPTKRAMIDIGRKCNLNCKFCYYHHLGDLSKQGWCDPNVLTKRIDDSHRIGNDYLDFTGGEPTIYPYIIDLIKYGLEKNMKSCIITNGQINNLQTEKILAAGIDDWLISVHSVGGMHDYLVGDLGAFERLEKFIELISSRMKFRFNVVINRFNQNELFEIVEWLNEWNPTIINFINMNVHYEWKSDVKGVQNVMADLNVVEKQLNKIIPFLEDNNVGVNIRYYPMCRISKEYRRCICNVLHVVFDPYEWDYPRDPKTVENYKQWGFDLCNERENKQGPCDQCDLQWICGGINTWFHKANEKEICNAIKDEDIKDKTDFYFYRKHNIKTLIQR